MTDNSDAILNCGLHNCAMRCHRVDDHSKMPCPHKVERSCERGHKLKMPCHMRNDKCRTCAQEDIEAERRIKRDLKLEADRQAREAAYKRELQEIQDEIDHERRTLRYRMDEEEQQKTLAQQRADLAAIKQAAERVLNAAKAKVKQAIPGSFSSPGPPTPPSDEGPPDNLQGLPEGASEEWEYLKRYEGAKSEPLDKLMGMIGLEEVKSECLSVKSKVDTAIRQGILLDKERFGCAMLGNPGTGEFTSKLWTPSKRWFCWNDHRRHTFIDPLFIISVSWSPMTDSLQGKQPWLVSMLNFSHRSASSRAAVSKKRQEPVWPMLEYLAARI
jgi:hypothetical protein